MENGTAQCIVGTHALIQPSVKYFKLGLAITDEQHRFGVRQRALLAEQGSTPDVLVMTATPIPRTLALILYGDMDLSVLNSLPRRSKLMSGNAAFSASVPDSKVTPFSFMAASSAVSPPMFL